MRKISKTGILLSVTSLSFAAFLGILIFINAQETELGFVNVQEAESEGLKAILANPAANMQLTTAREVRRSQNDKNIIRGRSYAEIRVDYEPIGNNTERDIYDEIVANIEAYGWEEEYETRNDNGGAYYVAKTYYGHPSNYLQISVNSSYAGFSIRVVEIFNKDGSQPFAWIGQAYSGKIGEPIQFDASGSYDPSELPLTLYEWDFNADGIFEFQSTEPIATHTYSEAFNDFVVMRVTGEGGTALASARTVVNTQGYALQGDEEPCELDENGFSIFIDEDGQFIACTADSLSTKDKDGVTVGGMEEVVISNDGNNGHHSGGCTISSLPVENTDRGDLWLLGGMLGLLGIARRRKAT